MAIRIIKQTEILKIENIIMTIYGQPGVGKTSLGFTADKPILFDFDGSGAVSRATIRKECVAINTWNDIVNITEEDIKDYNTIIIDTFGDLIEKLKPYVISLGGNGFGDNLSPKGWGVLKTNLIGFLNRLISYKKDIVVLCHTKEDKKGETIITRIISAGSSNQFIEAKSTMMGFMHSSNNRRVIDFGVRDDILSKDCAEIGKIEVPSIKNNINDNFLATLINRTKDKINEKEIQKEKRLADLNEFKSQIETLETAEDFTTYIQIAIDKNDVEYKLILNKKAVSLGFILNKEIMQYEPKTLES